MKYIIYCRKSSEDEDRQTQSLETQITILDEYAKKCNLMIVDRLEESRSAKKSGNRPLFNSMIKRINSGEVEGILVAHIDRLSRNGTESAIITSLLEEGKLKEIRTPSNIFNSAQDILFMDINFAFSSYYSRNLSVRVKEGIQTKLKKGEFPNMAPLGYINKDKKIYSDSEFVPLVKRVFELYSSGSYSLKQLVNKLYDEGFRSKYGSKIWKSTYERMLKNPVYVGLIPYNDKIFKGIHEPIISEELFESCQNINKFKSRPRPIKHDFLYRGFVKCDVCGCMFTTSLKIKPSQKKYIYYYCTNGKFICDQHKSYLRDNKIKDLAQSIFDNISETFDSEIAQLSLEAYYQSIKDETKFEEQSKTNTQELINKNKAKQDKLLDLLLEEKITQETYDTKLELLKTEEKDLIKKQNNKKQTNPDVTLELLNNFKSEAISLKNVFSEGDDQVKQDLLNSALWNFSVKDGKVAKIRYKRLYEKVAKVSKSDDFAKWLRGRDSNPNTQIQNLQSYH